MTWDPAQVEIHKVTASNPITNAQKDVVLSIEGVGFGVEGDMFAVFVGSGNPPSRGTLIPCNELKPTYGNIRVSSRICPLGKAPGKYDLVFWLASPIHVKDKQGNEVPNVPVNDVTVLKDAITVAAQDVAAK